ncbi:MAG: sulfite exporter TauE/SafE family protein [Alphaproteobacteria bacterium]|nr:sulfite exporter TauE/SafE family protein [Alphaproteobacteria bacterium]
MDTSTLTLIVAAFLIAGSIKGAIGVGLPTTAIAILGTGLALQDAIPLLIFPSLIANIWQIIRGGDLRELFRRFWLMNVIACVGIWVGTLILFRVESPLFSALLGLVIVVYTLTGLFAYAPRVPPHREAMLSPLVGLGAGLLTGTTGSLLMPMMIYLQALNLDKDRFVQAAGLSLLLGTIAWAAALTQQGAFETKVIMHSMFALIPTLFGIAFGQWIRDRLSQKIFRKIVYGFQFLLGLNLIYMGLL